jgi:hypothetical protein
MSARTHSGRTRPTCRDSPASHNTPSSVVPMRPRNSTCRLREPSRPRLDLGAQPFLDHVGPRIAWVRRFPKVESTPELIAIEPTSEARATARTTAGWRTCMQSAVLSGNQWQSVAISGATTGCRTTHKRAMRHTRRPWCRHRHRLLHRLLHRRRRRRRRIAGEGRRQGRRRRGGGS